MDTQRMRRNIAVGLILFAAACTSGRPSASTRPEPSVPKIASRDQTSATTVPTTGPSKLPLRRVDIGLMAPIDSLNGITWKEMPNATPKFALSIGIEQPCDVTIHLKSGKSINVQTRPILFISRLGLEDSAHDVVTEIQIPPESKPGRVIEKVGEVESFLKDWQAQPDAHMQALLNEFKSEPDHGVGRSGGEFPFMERVGAARIDPHTQVLFEFWRDDEGAWSKSVQF
jgi:hypothetical protein